MPTIDEGLTRVAVIAELVGVTELAREAGLPLSTVRSFRDRGWAAKTLPACDALIAAAARLEADPQRIRRLAHARAERLQEVERARARST